MGRDAELEKELTLTQTQARLYILALAKLKHYENYSKNSFRCYCGKKYHRAWCTELMELESKLRDIAND